MQVNPRLSNNNLDLLRFLFAGTVCLVHASELSGFKALSIITTVLSSEVAVDAFFIVSGFLIFMSYERSSSVYSYMNKRIRRVYPAYFVVVLLCAFGLLALSSKGINDYFSDSWLKYLLANLTFLNFLQHDLPGVFEQNNIQAVNGALWTLKIEVMFYSVVPLIVMLFSKFNRITVMATIYILSVIYSSLCLWLAEKTGSNDYLALGRQLPGQLCFFMAGAFFYYYLHVFERYVVHFLVFALVTIVGSYYWSLTFFLPFALATLVIFFGLFLYLGNFGKYGDFSYGVYILHFPIIQIFIHFGWLSGAPWLFLLVIVLTTLVGAVFIWHIIEKRFLKKSSHYILASNGASEKQCPDKSVHSADR